MLALTKPDTTIIDLVAPPVNKNRLVIFILLVVCAISIWGFQLFRGGGSKTTAEQKVQDEQRDFHCESCQHLFRESYRKVPPQKCPQCGKQSAVNADLAQCNVCQTKFPYALHKWPTDEQAKWEAQLAKSEEFTQESLKEFHRVQLSRTPATDWVAYEKFPPMPPHPPCPKCGNADPAKITVNRPLF